MDKLMIDISNSNSYSDNDNDSDNDSDSDGDETNTTIQNVIKFTRGIKNVDDVDDVEENVIISSGIHIANRSRCCQELE